RQIGPRSCAACSTCSRSAPVIQIDIAEGETAFDLCSHAGCRLLGKNKVSVFVGSAWPIVFQSGDLVWRSEVLLCLLCLLLPGIGVESLYRVRSAVPGTLLTNETWIWCGVPINLYFAVINRILQSFIVGGNIDMPWRIRLDFIGLDKRYYAAIR